MPFSLFNKNPLARFGEKELYKMYMERISEKDYDGAVEIADEFLRRGAQHHDGNYYKAMALSKIDPAKALPYFEKAIETHDESDGALFNLNRKNYAFCLLQNHLFDKAVDEYAKVYNYASQHSYLRELMDGFDFFLYLMAVRNLRWKFLKAGNKQAADELRVDINNKFFTFTYEGHPDEEELTHMWNMLGEITGDKDPAESDYQI